VTILVTGIAKWLYLKGKYPGCSINDDLKCNGRINPVVDVHVFTILYLLVVHVSMCTKPTIEYYRIVQQSVNHYL